MEKGPRSPVDTFQAAHGMSATPWDPALLWAELDRGRTLEEVLSLMCKQADEAVPEGSHWVLHSRPLRGSGLSLGSPSLPVRLARFLANSDPDQLAEVFSGTGHADLLGAGIPGELLEIAQSDGIQAVSWASNSREECGPCITLLSFHDSPPQVHAPWLELLRTLRAFAQRLACHSESSPAIAQLPLSERSLFRALPQSALIVSVLDGRILDANPAACELYGHARESFFGLTLASLSAQESQGLNAHRRVHVRADGSALTVDITSTPLMEGETPLALVLIRDASGASRTETALQESDARYRGLFESAPISIWEEDFSAVKLHLSDNGIPTDPAIGERLQERPELLRECLDRIQVRAVNLKALELYGVSSQRSFYNHLACIQEANSLETLRLELQSFSSGKLTFETELKTRTAQGLPKEIALVARMAPGAEDSWARLLVCIMDMTERNQAVEDLRRSRAILSEAQNMAEMGSAEVDLVSRRIHWSKEALQLWQWNLSKAPPTLTQILRLIHSEDRPLFFRACRRLMSEGAPLDLELRIGGKQLDGRVIALKVRPELDQAKGPIRLVAAFQNITQRTRLENTLREEETRYRKLAEENAELLGRFRTEAEEKSILLQEVNHRVKNNLTSILGMLDMELQASLRSGSEAASSFEDLKERIFALSTVHELLSASQWSPLRLDGLATDLIRNSLAGSPVSHLVRLDVSPSRERVWVNASGATALAMILAELTTNSIKYAFESRGTGRIILRIRPLKDAWGRVSLTFQDDGPGFPQEVLEGVRENVGLKLIRLNVRSLLRGELVLDNQQGARVRISFQPMPLGRRSQP